MADSNSAAASQGGDASTGNKIFSGSTHNARFRDLVAGMSAGFVCKAVEYPFDTLKVIMQTNSSKYTGVWNCFSTILRESGYLSLYKGLTSPLLGSMLECATLFVSYGQLKQAVGVTDEEVNIGTTPLWKLFMLGGGAGFTTAFVLTPVELVKCRLQIQAQQSASEAAASASTAYKGPIDVIRRTVAQEGIRGLWKGQMSCLAREVPGNMAWFGFYEAAMRMFKIQGGYASKQDVPLGFSALSGSIAGIGYWGVPYPADSIKSRIQTDPRVAGRGFFSIGKQIVKEEGIAGLYRGCGMTCGRAVFSHAIIFYFYEIADRFLLKF